VLRRISCCEHAVIHAPADGRTAYFTRAMRPGSLPHVLAGSASALDGFGTCSMFIPITACSLADSLFTGAFYIEGSEQFITSLLASTATGWSESCRVGLVNSPTGVPRLFTAHKHGRAYEGLSIPTTGCIPSA